MPKTYIAEFCPQAWVRDHAVGVDAEGKTTWDATEFVASADPEWLARTLERGRDHDDILRTDPNAPEWVREWSGPFDTELREAARVCQHCGYEGGEGWKADYYEAVAQTIDYDEDGDLYHYTGNTHHYDDGSTEDECVRCPNCGEAVETFGRFTFIPAKLIETVDEILRLDSRPSAAEAITK